jgi:hypothetical protein
VLVVNNENVVENRRVTLGTAIDGMRVVNTGIQAGDRVVVNGLQRARPGATVVPEFPKPAEEAPPAQTAGGTPAVEKPATESTSTPAVATTQSKTGA